MVGVGEEWLRKKESIGERKVLTMAISKRMV
jgi:hypothetical protein